MPLDICRGYYFKGDIIFNKGTENELKASPSLLINDEPCIDNNGELLWFPEPNFQTKREKGTFRHAQCIRAAYKGQMPKSVCKFCLSIANLKTYQSEDNSDYTDLFESAMIIGEPRICNLLADNLGGPNSETIKLWTKKNSFEYDFSNFEKTFEFIASLYKSCKIRIQESRKVPYLKAEDETAIEARPTYDEKLDCVWGYCGPLDHRECEENFVIFVGNEEDAYERLVEAMNTSKLANYARVIMINPLHERLPRIVLHLQANCNCFTHNTVIHQWLKYDAICNEILDPILGPDIGKSSDGDGRRRKLMLNQSSDFNEGQRYKPVPIDEGFLFSANTTQNSEGEFVINNLSDQDYIHNHKKLDNQLDYVSKDLKLGNYPVHRNFLRLVCETFSRHEHGLRSNDVNKTDRQNWAAAQRTCFPSVRLCLQHIIDGQNEKDAHDPMALGLLTYLKIVWYYMEIFISLQANLKERISYAALVTTFLGIWRNYIILHPGLNLKENFITRETFQDVLLSCHFSVMLIGIFAEKYSYLECPLHLTGTDAVEIYFSQNGSFVLNKHTYTILDMKRNLSAMNRLIESNTGDKPEHCIS